MKRLNLLLIACAMLYIGHVQADPSTRQIKLFSVNCAQCHVGGNRFIPTMGRAKDWVERNRRGEDALVKSVMQGLGGMPPSGYCSACDEADIRVLVRLVAGLKEGQQ
ncbi:c-type cytochrome [Marinobacterium sp. D7]|uniref:c-type cytochrome n=1 Tax=Marinobacterium ramblicola TaxID=2849041 RepID=UPI001C2CD314|nr:c-type cytochrome [Marinobacterium ramblicola]MBV1788476.1 c-type cytochrome [Marinobacterium ramblicola]